MQLFFRFFFGKKQYLLYMIGCLYVTLYIITKSICALLII